MVLDKGKIRKLLIHMGFQEEGTNRFVKRYRKHNGYEIVVDLKKKEIDYNGIQTENEKVKPQGRILIGEKTTSNLSQPENLVVLECVNRLLEKGYQPQHLHLEKKWKIGRTGKGGRADIVVYDRKTDPEGNLKPLMIIECKTWGTEFEKEKRRLKENGGQLFSYLQQERDAKYLVLYTSDVFESEKGDFIDYDNVIIKVIDDEEKVRECREENKRTGKERPCSFKDAPTKVELHEVWKRLYRASWHKHGIFDEDALPYDIELKPLKKKDLVELGNAQGLFNKFAEILRHNNISDNANAFNKMLNLILCKLVDEEEKMDDQELDFQVKGDEEYEKLVDRLQRLYREGMVRYLNIKDFVYHSDEEIENLIKVYPERANLEEVLRLFKEIKYYTNNEFAFKEVHNKRLFDENAEILIEVIEMIQNYRFRNSKNYHILGDFFELLLDFGVKQSEGQFFTPIPIVQFINGSLNPRKIVEFKLSHERYKHTPIPKFLDYACGAGHFLTDMIEKFRELIREFPELQEYVQENPKWERDFIFGIEKDYRLARTAKIACFLANDGDANVIYGDGLDDHEELRLKEEKIDLMATNPPYSIRKFKRYLDVRTDFELLNYISEDAKEIEVLFIERAKQVLKEKTGRIGIILPSSILTNSGIYEKARELILKHFEIKGIVEIGSNAFIATGTNTVILFMKRRDDNFVKDRERISEEIFSGRYFTDERVKRDYVDALKLLEKFIEFRELPKEDYISFVREGVLSEELLNTEIFKDYRKDFEDKVKKDNEIKKLKGKKREERIKEKFLEYLKEKEREKFFYFLLTFLEGEKPDDERFYTFQRVFVVKAPESKDEQKRFLGYEFSKRRGYEGIVIYRDENGKMTTKLYDPENYDNPNKVSAYIRKSFEDEYLEVSEEIKPYGKWMLLPELIDWDKVEFDKAINLEGYRKVLIESKYPLVKVKDLLDNVNGAKTKVKESEIRPQGSIPVITQESNTLISGYVEGVEPITDLPLVIFGDHTCVFKYVDFPFVRGADGVQLIKVKSGIDPKYVYYVLSSSEIPDKGKYKRHFKILKELRIPLPPIDVQRKIVEEIEKIEKEQKEKRERVEKLRGEIFELLRSQRSTVRIKDIAKLYTEKIEPQKHPDELFNYIGLENIESNTGRLINFAPTYGKKIKSTKNVFKKGHVLYGKLRPYLNKVWLAEFDGICSTDILVLETDYPLILKYSLLDENFVQRARRQMRGANHPRISPKDLMNMEIKFDYNNCKTISKKIRLYENGTKHLQDQIKKYEQKKREIFEKFLLRDT